MSVTIVILPILHRKREGYVEEFNFSDIVPTKAEIAANENKVRIILVGGDSSKPSIPGLENSVTNLNRWIWEDSKKEVKSLEFSSKMTEKWLWDNNIDESLEDGTKLDDLIVVTLSSTVMSRLDCMIYLETQRYKNRAYIHGDLKTRISIKTCLSELSAIKLAREIKKGKTVVVGDQEDKSMFNYPNKDITYELLSTRILPEDISSM